MGNILSEQKYNFITGGTTNNKKLIERIIGETEFLNFRKLVGDSVYYGIIAEMESQDGYTEQLNALLEAGIYKCIAYFSYANYLLQGNIQNTYSGAVQKNNPYSDHISSGTAKNLFTHYSDLAIEYWKKVEDETRAYFGEGCLGNGNESFEKFHEVIGVRRGQDCGCKTRVSQL